MAKMRILFDRCQVWTTNYDFFGRPAKTPVALPWKVTYRTYEDSFATHAEALEFAVKGGRNGSV